MTPATQHLAGRLVERVERLAQADLDLEGYATAVCDEIHGVVPSVFTCLGVTDPATGLITCAVKSHELPCGDEEMMSFELGAPDLNQFADLTTRPEPVASLWLDTDGQPEKCRRYADFLHPRFGFTDELRAVLTEGGLMWAALGLHRGTGDTPFSRIEREALFRVIPIVVKGLRHSLFRAASGSSRAQSTFEAPAVVIVTGSTFEASAAGLQAIEDLGGLDHGDLPTSLLSVVSAVRGGAPSAMLRTRDCSGRWVTVRAAPLRDETYAAGPGHAAYPSSPATTVVLSVTATNPAELSPLAFDAYGLTRREQDVAGLVLQGASTATIAQSLVLSPHTVQDHLKSIFRKAGVASRRDLIGRFVGTS